MTRPETFAGTKRPDTRPAERPAGRRATLALLAGSSGIALASLSGGDALAACSVTGMHAGHDPALADSTGILCQSFATEGRARASRVEMGGEDDRFETASSTITLGGGARDTIATLGTMLRDVPAGSANSIASYDRSTKGTSILAYAPTGAVISDAPSPLSRLVDIQVIDLLPQDDRITPDTVVIGADQDTASLAIGSNDTLTSDGAALVDQGGTASDVDIYGTIAGGAGGAAVDLGAGDDTLRISGAITGASSGALVTMGEGDDLVTFESVGVVNDDGGALVSGGAGHDTLILGNGAANASSDFLGFETVAVGAGTSLAVDDDQSDATVMVGTGGSATVSAGGEVDRLGVWGDSTATIEAGGRAAMLTARDAGSAITVRSGGAGGVATDSATDGAVIVFDDGSTALVAAVDFAGNGNAVTYDGVSFLAGTTVEVANAAFLSATSSGSDVVFTIDADAFTARASTRNTQEAALALQNALIVNPAFLDGSPVVATADLANAGNILSAVSGEAAAQVASASVNAHSLFSSMLKPGAGTTLARTSALPVGITEYGAPIDPLETFANSFIGRPTPREDYFADVLDAPEITVAHDGGTGARVWGAGFLGGLDVDAGVSNPFHSITYGIAAGVEMGLSYGWWQDVTVGAAIGATRTDTQNVAYDNKSEGLHAGAYASARIESFALATSAALSRFAEEVGNTARSAFAVSGTLEAAWEGLGQHVHQLGDLGVAPLVRLGFTHASFDSLGRLDPSAILGAAAPIVGQGGLTQATVGLGVRATKKVGRATGSIEAIYERVLGDDETAFDVSFGNGAAFGGSVTAPATGRDRFTLGGELAYEVAGGELAFDASATFADGVSSYGLGARLSYDF